MRLQLVTPRVKVELVNMTIKTWALFVCVTKLVYAQQVTYAS